MQTMVCPNDMLYRFHTFHVDRDLCLLLDTPRMAVMKRHARLSSTPAPLSEDSRLPVFLQISQMYTSQ